MTVYLQHKEIRPREWIIAWRIFAPEHLRKGKPWLLVRAVSAAQMASEACYREGWKKWGGPK